MEEKTMKKSIFKREILREIYQSEYPNKGFGYPSESLTKEKKDEEEIFSCDLELPLLKAGDYFYIEEKNEAFFILAVMRTSKDSVCYFTNPVVVRDEITELTFNRVKALNKIDELRQKNRELAKTIESIKKSFWCKFIRVD